MTPEPLTEDGLERDKAFKLAYRYFTKRDRSEAQLRERLEREDCGAELLDEVVEQLQEQNFLDDERFARCFVEDKRRIDGWGAQRILAGLRNAGIAEELSQAALAELAAGDETELDAAIAALRSRSTADLTDPQKKQRALAMLVRRGYELDTAYQAVRKVGEDQERGVR